MKHLFIMAQPRSGSTLCQRLINSDPNFCILGEHAGLLRGLSRSWAFKQLEEEFMATGDRYFFKEGNVSDTLSWTGLRNGLDFDDVTKIFRQFCDGIIQPAVNQSADTVGFKEIRYGYRGDHVMRMLHSLYEDAKFILLFRNPLDQIRSATGSGNFPGDIDSRCELYVDQGLSFLRFNQAHPNDTILLEYTDLWQTPEKWLEFIGSSWTDRHEKTLDVKVGSTPQRFTLSHEEIEILKFRCSTVYQALTKAKTSNPKEVHAKLYEPYGIHPEDRAVPTPLSTGV